MSPGKIRKENYIDHCKNEILGGQLGGGGGSRFRVTLHKMAIDNFGNFVFLGCGWFYIVLGGGCCVLK